MSALSGRHATDPDSPVGDIKVDGSMSSIILGLCFPAFSGSDFQSVIYTEPLQSATRNSLSLDEWALIEVSG